METKSEFCCIEAVALSFILLKTKPMKRILLLVASSALLNCFILAQTSDVKPAGNSFSDSVEERIQTSKKNAIRIYPNPSYGKLSVSSTKSTVLHFYIFDLEGTLVYQAVLTN